MQYRFLVAIEKQAVFTTPFEQSADAEFTVHDNKNNIGMSGRNRFIHDNDISHENSGFIHIISSGTEEKTGMFPYVEYLVKIDA